MYNTYNTKKVITLNYTLLQFTNLFIYSFIISKFLLGLYTKLPVNNQSKCNKNPNSIIIKICTLIPTNFINCE